MLVDKYSSTGIVASVPLTQENTLTHDDYGPTYNCGGHMVIERYTVI